jgi:tetratricopeptide (TPR) repeat protein
MESGRIEEGIALLEKACEQYEKIGLGLFKSLIAIQLSDAYLRAGRSSEASACLDRALQIARDRGERGYEAHGLFVLGEIAARTEPPDEDHALQCYRSALLRAEELGMEPLAAKCHRALGRLFSETESAKANEHTLKAKELLQGLGLEPSDQTVK